MSAHPPTQPQTLNSAWRWLFQRIISIHILQEEGYRNPEGLFHIISYQVIVNIFHVIIVGSVYINKMMDKFLHEGVVPWFKTVLLFWHLH